MQVRAPAAIAQPAAADFTQTGKGTERRIAVVVVSVFRSIVPSLPGVLAVGFRILASLLPGLRLYGWKG
jgi:hypothetical protein